MRDLGQDPSTGALRRILARAAAAGLASERQRDTASPDEALAFILDRIDSCVLGRRLTVEVNGSTRIVMDVSGRRLLQVSCANDARPDLTGMLLSAADASQVEGIADWLTALCSDCRRVSVRSGSMPEAPPGTGSGIPVPRLRNALGLPETEAAPAPFADIPPDAILAEHGATDGWRIEPDRDPAVEDWVATMETCLADAPRLASLLDAGSSLRLELAPGVFGCLTLRDGAIVAVIAAIAEHPQAGSCPDKAT
ncbi:hypothetical protein [Thetidibacter halocola]|uniref:Uncharacterized protein n=1 Tax=Thetidibacter halocola TaxID=2827239 RepID=A0A8J8B7G7_9RHOB|nr:hypothetical protein [Thetidibacter halocola]MBS0123694.1 hypothetical protein [Thetidibacter halocola]